MSVCFFIFEIKKQNRFFHFVLSLAHYSCDAMYDMYDCQNSCTIPTNDGLYCKGTNRKLIKFANGQTEQSAIHVGISESLIFLLQALTNWLLLSSFPPWQGALAAAAEASTAWDNEEELSCRRKYCECTKNITMELGAYTSWSAVALRTTVDVFADCPKTRSNSLNQ